MGKLTQINLATVAFLFFGSYSWAVPIGIVDSGTDMKHTDLTGKVWTNPGGLPGDTYKDDTHGWNFAENNNQVIDYSYLGKFSPDVKKFFDLQLKIMTGTASEEEKQWMDQKRKDKDFIAELMKYGNFVHGTHVAGIASSTADLARVMAAKIIPTEVKAPALPEIRSLMSDLNLTDTPASGMGDMLMQGALSMLIDQQLKLLITVGDYLKATQMRVANCSFGTSMVQAKTVAGALGKMLLGHDLTDAEAEKYGLYFMTEMTTKGEKFVSSSPQTMYVIAAGNDGTNNDQLPIFPANIKVGNTISVAATRGYDSLASFSNYGEKNVEIAAPGVGIVSAVPGDDHVALSGTSQATPFITRIVGKMLDANPNLAFQDLKQILFETVDKKSYLTGKVKSGGVANEERAIRATVLSTRLTIAQAIQQARREIADIRVNRLMSVPPGEGYAIPLPSLFTVL